MSDKYAVNYDDEKLTNIQNEQLQKETEISNNYNKMIDNTDQFYNAQIEASKDWANKQNEIQQANTNFTIEKIEQEKQKAQKDYTKEQKGAYADYTKQTNDYSVNAEKMAGLGLTNTGYSENSKVSMYNTYQNRVASARESYNQAVLNYNNSIKEAQLNNNAKLAEIAADALKNQLELALAGFQYKNTLIQTKQEQLAANSDRYNQRYQQMLSQINDELNRNMQYDTWKSEFDEKNRQWEKEMAQQNKQWQEEMAMKKDQFRKEYALKQKEYQLSASRASSSSRNSYAVKETGTKKMSNTAKKINDEFLKIYNGSSKSSYIKQNVTNLLVNASNKGTITTDEMYQILNNLGLR